MRFIDFRRIFLFISVCLLMACNQDVNDGVSATFQSSFESDIQLEMIHEWTLNDPERFPNLTFFQFTGDGNLVVGDSSVLKIYLIDKEGNILQTFAREGRGPGELISLVSLATHPDGKIAVADMNNRVIHIFNTADGSFLTIDYIPGWNTTLHWIDEKLFMVNNPFIIRIRNVPSGSWVIKLYDPVSDTKEELMILELELQNEPPDQISCTFCPIAFADEHSFYTIKNDSTYRFHKVDIQTGEYDTFDFSGISTAVKFSESELERIRESRRRSSEISGVDRSDIELPTFKRRFVNLFVDAEKRVWFQLNVPEDSPGYFDVFSENGDYLGFVKFPENAQSVAFLNQSNILFRLPTDDPDRYSLKLYGIR